MKKFFATFLVLVSCFCLCTFMLTACGEDEKYPEPPEGVINPDSGNNSGGNTQTPNGDTQTPNGDTQTPNGDNGSENKKPSQNNDILENAVSVRIGLVNRTSYYVHMYNNAAANTMLNYLSSTEMRFPSYNYNESGGFVAQSVRGSYTRNDEITVKDVKKGELYLFSGGQLRLYFRDVAGANITATPIGYFADSSNVDNAVTTAYTENRGDVWNVDVYFLITKNK